MELSSFKVFLTLADRLHFGKTAGHHHMTTSNVTRIIKQLEEELGVPLFERTNRDVRLTHQGKKFEEFALETLQRFESLKDDIQEKDPTQQGGSIRLCATVTAAYNILPSIITRFRERYPKMTTYLETGNTHTGLEKLENGDVDFAIGIITDRLRQRFDVQKILTTPLVYIVPKAYDSTSSSELEMVLPESGELAESIQNYFDAAALKPTIHSYIEGHEAILAMVSSGMGGAILPQIVVENSHLSDQVKSLQLSVPLPSIDVGVFMNAGRLNQVAKQTFWQFLEADLKRFKQ
jgi:LysR family positive regulator for ilvC